MTRDRSDPPAPFPAPSRVLAGKTVLVTGAARRVGATIARVLHGAGANIALHYRSSAADAERLAGELTATRAGSVCLMECDLLDVTQHAALIAATDWDDLIGTNLKAPLFLAQAAASALHARGGLIINLADIHGMRPLRRYPVYSIAKAGLIMLTRALARELGPHVRVNAVAPGPVMWPEDGLDPALEAKIIERTALKRTGSALDVARACLYFAADAPYVTGQVLAVDGGRSIGW